MANWYYYNNSGQKVGPIRGQELSVLVQNGTVTLDTLIENEEGKQAKAGKIQGLTFSQSAEAPIVQPPPLSVPVSVPPPPPQNKPENNGTLSPLLLFIYRCRERNHSVPFISALLTLIGVAIILLVGVVIWAGMNLFGAKLQTPEANSATNPVVAPASEEIAKQTEVPEKNAPPVAGSNERCASVGYPALIVLEGFTDSGAFVTYSPDGKNVVTGSHNGTARIWDAVTGKELHRFEHITGTKSAIYSPDGKNIVTGGDYNTARIWDAATGEELHKLEGHTKGVGAVAYSPDGKNVVTGSDDNTVCIWDAITGKELCKLEGHTGHIVSATYSPAGKNIVTASGDNTARIWDASTGKELHKLAGHTDGLMFATYSPDGKNVVTASFDNTARIWNTSTGKELRKLEGHEWAVNSAVYSPDGKNVVTASWDNTARIWDASTGKELRKLEGHEGTVNSAVYSPDGKNVVTVGDYTARIWDASTGKELYKLGGHTGRLDSAVYSPDGKNVATVGDKTARIGNPQKWEQALAAEKARAEAEVKQQAEAAKAKTEAEAKQKAEEDAKAEQERKKLLANAVPLSTYMTAAGFSDTNQYSLEAFVQYGTRKLADGFRKADEFDKADLEKNIAIKQSEMLKKCFMIPLSYTAENIKIDGDKTSMTLVVPLNLRIMNGDCKFQSFDKGIGGWVYVSELNANWTGFMLKDGTVRSCNGREAKEVFDSGGAVYLGENTYSHLRIEIIDGSTKKLKDLAKQASNYQIEVFVTGFHWGQCTTGLFKHTGLTDYNDKPYNTHLRRGPSGMSEEEQPEYFITGKGKERVLADIVEVRLVKK